MIQQCKGPYGTGAAWSYSFVLLLRAHATTYSYTLENIVQWSFFFFRYTIIKIQSSPKRVG